MEFFQARRLEWLAVSSSRGSSRPGDQTLMTLNLLHYQACLFFCFFPLQIIQNYMKERLLFQYFRCKINIGLYLISVLIKCSPFVVGLGRMKWQPLQCSCLRNPVDRRAWWAAVHGVAQIRTRLKRLSMHALEKALAAHSSVLRGESQEQRSLGGCRLWLAQSRTRLK